MFTGNAAYKARCQFVRVTSVLCHVPHSAAFQPLFAAKNHRFSTFFCRNLFGEDEYDNSEFFKVCYLIGFLIPLSYLFIYFNLQNLLKSPNIFEGFRILCG